MREREEAAGSRADQAAVEAARKLDAGAESGDGHGEGPGDVAVEPEAGAVEAARKREQAEPAQVGAERGEALLPAFLHEVACRDLRRHGADR